MAASVVTQIKKHLYYVLYLAFDSLAWIIMIASWIEIQWFWKILKRISKYYIQKSVLY